MHKKTYSHSHSVKYIPGTNDTDSLVLAGVLLPARLIAVTLNVYISHSVEFPVMLSLLIVMVVEEVLNIVMVVVLVLLVLVTVTV